MTILEIGLLIIGAVFFIGSFFISEKLSSSDVEEIKQMSEREVRILLERQLKDADKQIEKRIKDKVETSFEEVERRSDREFNERIMSLGEYSDNILSKIDNTHKEIVFMYDIMNERQEQLTQLMKDAKDFESHLRGITEEYANAAAAYGYENPSSAVPQAAQPVAYYPEPASGYTQEQVYSELYTAPMNNFSQENQYYGDAAMAEGYHEGTYQQGEEVYPAEAYPAEGYAAADGTYQQEEYPEGDGQYYDEATPAEAPMEAPAPVKESQQQSDPEDKATAAKEAASGGKAKEAVKEEAQAEPEAQPAPTPAPAPAPAPPALDLSGESEDDNGERVMAMFREGYTQVEIAKKTGVGLGEIQLILGLYGGDNE